jgi:nitroreductase
MISKDKRRKSRAFYLLLIWLLLPITACQHSPKAPASIYELMQDRYTVRSFDPSKKLSQEHIKQIVEAGMLSPSKNKLWPYRVVVLTDSQEGKALRKELWAKHTTCFHCLGSGQKLEQRLNSIITAPLNILFFLDYKRERYEKRGRSQKESDFPLANEKTLLVRSSRDAMIASTVMMLQAQQLGYGTAFSGVFWPTGDFKKRINIAPESRPFVVLSVGHPLDREKSKEGLERIKVQFDCLGESVYTSSFSVIERDKDDRPTVFSKILNKGPNNSVNKKIVEYF